MEKERIRQGCDKCPLLCLSALQPMSGGNSEGSSCALPLCLPFLSFLMFLCFFTSFSTPSLTVIFTSLTTGFSKDLSRRHTKIMKLVEKIIFEFFPFHFLGSVIASLSLNKKKKRNVSTRGLYVHDDGNRDEDTNVECFLCARNSS